MTERGELVPLGVLTPGRLEPVRGPAWRGEGAERELQGADALGGHIFNGEEQELGAFGRCSM